MVVNLPALLYRLSRVAFYTVEQAADDSNLAPGTIRKYCRGYSDLVRGEDFYVHRYAARRRKLYITERGLFRLKARAYRSFPSGGGISGLKPSSADFVGFPLRYSGVSVEEFRQRLGNRIHIVFMQYIATPCAVPQCPCMVHRLGLPQADELARDRAALEERKAARKVKYGK